MMSHYIHLFFGGFGVALLPSLVFYMVLLGFRTIAECVNVSAD